MSNAINDAWGLAAGLLLMLKPDQDLDRKSVFGFAMSVLQICQLDRSYLAGVSPRRLEKLAEAAHIRLQVLLNRAKAVKTSAEGNGRMRKQTIERLVRDFLLLFPIGSGPENPIEVLDARPESELFREPQDEDSGPLPVPADESLTKEKTRKSAKRSGLSPSPGVDLVIRLSPQALLDLCGGSAELLKLVGGTEGLSRHCGGIQGILEQLTAIQVDGFRFDP